MISVLELTVSIHRPFVSVFCPYGLGVWGGVGVYPPLLTYCMQRCQSLQLWAFDSSSYSLPFKAVPGPGRQGVKWGGAEPR